MWAISCYFNPAGFSTKLANCKLFLESLKRQSVPVLMVELAFGSDPFVIEDDWATRVIRVRGNSVLFQKERLLNIALEHIPAGKFAWLDCDVIFENDYWAVNAECLLDIFPIIQLFSQVKMLSLYGEVTECPWSAACEQQYPFMKRSLQTHLPGPLGYAWASHTDLMRKHGFYDRNIVGGGDVTLAWAIYGRQIWPGTNHARFFTQAHLADMAKWSFRFYEDVQGDVSYLPGAITHLWHGTAADRRYADRHRILVEATFDPAFDIRISENGCWEWASEKPAMHQVVREYFWNRRESLAAQV